MVGDSGLGKTTLVKTLLSTPGERLQVHDGTYTPTEQFVKDPESLCSTVTWKDEDDRVIWVYRIQDTPGYGDDLDVMNHINMIIKCVLGCVRGVAGWSCNAVWLQIWLEGLAAGRGSRGLQAKGAGRQADGLLWCRVYMCPLDWACRRCPTRLNNQELCR